MDRDIELGGAVLGKAPALMRELAADGLAKERQMFDFYKDAE